MENKKLLVFHHTDLDGMGVKIVGLIIGKALGYTRDNIETYKCNYEDIDEAVEKRLDAGIDDIGHIIIGDISIQSMDVANRLDDGFINKKYSLTLRDHHATAMWMNDFEWAEVREVDDWSTPRCGTFWTYKAFYDMMSSNGFINDTLVEFVRLVDLYDTFMFQADKDNIIWDADKLNSIFKMVGEEKFTEMMMENIGTDGGVFDDMANYLYEIHTTKLDNKAKSLAKGMYVGKYVFYASSANEPEYWDKVMKFYKEHRNEPDKVGAEKEWYESFWSKIHNSSIEIQFNVGMIFYNENISDISRRILESRPDIDFLITVSLPGLMSFRSQKELPIPLGIIAEYTTGSGGGHPKSAGAKINPDSTLDVLNNLLIPIHNIKKENN